MSRIPLLQDHCLVPAKLLASCYRTLACLASYSQSQRETPRRCSEAVRKQKRQEQESRSKEADCKARICWRARQRSAKLLLGATQLTKFEHARGCEATQPGRCHAAHIQQKKSPTSATQRAARARMAAMAQAVRGCMLPDNAWSAVQSAKRNRNMCLCTGWWDLGSCIGNVCYDLLDAEPKPALAATT